VASPSGEGPELPSGAEDDAERVPHGTSTAAWTARALPADPKLFDAVTALPLMSNARAKSEPGWQPTRSAEAVRGG
jgi:hypothetical protein